MVLKRSGIILIIDDDLNYGATCTWLIDVQKMEIKTSDLDANTTMMAAEIFENIIFQIQNSHLNFKLNSSLFAANISLKKSLVKNKSGIPLLPRANAVSDNIEFLIEKNHQLENELVCVKNEFSSKVNECGSAVCEELEKSCELVKKLQIVNADLVKENEIFKNKIVDQETEIKDLENSNKIHKGVSEELNKKISELKTKFSKEKIDINNKNKAEIKYWRKEFTEKKRRTFSEGFVHHFIFYHKGLQ